MTEEVKPKGKPGRKAKVVAESKPEVVEQKVEVLETSTETVETAKGTEVTELPAAVEAPEKPVDVIESISDTDGAPKPEIVVDEAAEAPEKVLEDEVVESKPEVVDEAAETKDEDKKEDKPKDQPKAPANFKPILRPTSVRGEPVGYMAVPRAIFELVTRDENWRDKVETHPAKVGLQSVLYWVEINGKQQVRCQSSSKFADVL